MERIYRIIVDTKPIIQFNNYKRAFQYYQKSKDNKDIICNIQLIVISPKTNKMLQILHNKEIINENK